jgi:hypothetical protein
MLMRMQPRKDTRNNFKQSPAPSAGATCQRIARAGPPQAISATMLSDK